MAEETGTWVYAVTADEGTELPRVPGIGGTPVRAVAEAGLVAVVSPVDLSEYGEEPLRRNLEDLQWLEATARAHHGVIHAVAEARPAVPMQLATVYRGEERVRAMLAERRDDLQAVLDDIRARSEWGVKLYVSRASGAAREDPAEPAASDRPGAAYLRRRRSELSDRERARAAAASSAEQIHAELAALSAATRLHKPQHPQLTGRAEPMILNAAYLVDDESATAFAAAADELAGRHPGIELELTGPWPPYSFTLPGEEEAAATPESVGR